MKLGAIDFLQKPLRPEELRRVVAETVERHAAPREQAAESFHSHIVAAKRCLNMRSFAMARTHLIKALELNKKWVEALNLAGVLAETLDEVDQAKKYYGQAIRLNTRNGRAWRPPRDLCGLGEKRLAGIRDSLAHRLSRVRPYSAGADGSNESSVAALLDVDVEYRRESAAGRLTRIAPRRFNAEGRAWLPFLHSTRGDRHYTALYSNTVTHTRKIRRAIGWCTTMAMTGASLHRHHIRVRPFEEPADRLGTRG